MKERAGHAPEPGGRHVSARRWLGVAASPGYGAGAGRVPPGRCPAQTCPRARPPPPCRHCFAGWFAARGWDAAPAPAGDAPRGGAGAACPAGRADRRRQDPGRLPAQPDRARRRTPRRGAAHALRLAAEGAGGRHRAATSSRRSPRWGSPSAPRPAPATRRRPSAERQRDRPPHILLTTPESLALLLSFPEAARDVRAACARVIVDELHALAPHQARRPAGARPRAARGARAAARRVGLSATVADPRGARALARARAPSRRCRAGRSARRRRGARDRDPAARGARCPGSGTWACTRMPEVYERDPQRAARPWSSSTPARRPSCASRRCGGSTTTSCRSRCTTAASRAEQRRKVEAAMAAGRLRAVVAHLLARPRHRLGRRRPGDPGRRAQGRVAPAAAHRPRQPPADEPSPRAAGAGQPLRGAGMPRRDATRCDAGELDGDPPRPGGARRAGAASCSAAPASAPFDADALYAEVRRAGALRRAAAQGLRRRARLRRHRRLRAARLRPLPPAGPRRADGRWRVADDRGRAAVPDECRHHRRGADARRCGSAAAGRARRGRGVLRPAAWCPATPSCSPASCCASRACARSTVDGHAARKGGGSRRCRPMTAAGCRSPPTSPTRVRGILADPRRWQRAARRRCASGCGCSGGARVLPRPDGLLVETFPRGGQRHFLVAYCFEGRNAHQTLGMLLTRRMERAGPRAARLRRHRLRARDLDACEPATRRRRAVRRGHAGRRPRGVDGGIEHAASGPSATSPSSPG